MPGLFGGSKKKSEEHLRKSLTYNPNSTASLFFLAETLIDEDRKPEARDELAERDRRAASIRDWAPEDREFKEKAQRLLDDRCDRTLRSQVSTPSRSQPVDVTRQYV